MKKTIKRIFSAILCLSLLCSFSFGAFCSKETKAGTTVELGKWTFEQGGVYASTQETNWGNVGYIDYVIMDSTNESLYPWPTDEGSKNYRQTANGVSDGFNLCILNNGWDRAWKTVTGYSHTRLNPWSIQSSINSSMDKQHYYKISFKAKATSKKYGYVVFKTDSEEYGDGVKPYGDLGIRSGSSNEIITLNSSEKTFTYYIDNYVGGSELTTTLMWGAFGPDEDNNITYDMDGKNVSNIVTEEEKMWNGSVYVHDFKVEDMGVNPDLPKYSSTTHLEIPRDLEVNLGESFVYPVKLYDEFGSPLENKPVYLTVDDNTFCEYTNRSGSALFILTLNNPGEHLAYAEFNGDESYESCYEADNIYAGGVTPEIKDYWTSYFGLDSGWYEGSSGLLTSNTSNSFTAKVTSFGWGGCWGGQISRKVKIEKGKEYDVSFNIKSSNVDKYVYMLVGEGMKTAFSEWIKLPKGEEVSYNKTFVAEQDADKIIFGIGGDPGDRTGMEQDAEYRYSVFDSQFGKNMHYKLMDWDCEGDFSASSIISVNFSKFFDIHTIPTTKPAPIVTKVTPTNNGLTAITGLKAKNKKKRKAVISWNKLSGAKKYQIKYAANKKLKKAKTKNTSSNRIVLKKLKKKIYYYKVRGVNAPTYGPWSKLMKVKIKK